MMVFSYHWDSNKKPEKKKKNLTVQSEFEGQKNCKSLISLRNVHSPVHCLIICANGNLIFIEHCCILPKHFSHISIIQYILETFHYFQKKKNQTRAEKTGKIFGHLAAWGLRFNNDVPADGWTEKHVLICQKKQICAQTMRLAISKITV